MSDVTIETFRGDAEALQAMAHAAWLDEYGADSYPNLYRPEYVAYLLGLAGNPELAIAAYQDDRPIGFVLNLPRRVVLRGEEKRAALSCSLVVSRECLRRGVAKAMIAEGLARNRRFDITCAGATYPSLHGAASSLRSRGPLARKAPPA